MDEWPDTADRGTTDGVEARRAGDRRVDETLRRRLDDVFGDVLPDVTRDELDDTARRGNDDDLLRDRPPHHDRD